MPPPFDAVGLHVRYAEIEREVYARVTEPRGVLSTARAQDRIAEAQRREFKRTLGEYLRQTARTFGYEVVIPGTHDGGLSNQALFELLAERGWNYGADTRRLRDYVKLALLDAFDASDLVPLRFEVEQTIAGAVLEWVARRLDRTVSDVRRPALAPAYARAKRRRFGSGRAGSARGDLADAIRDHGRLVIS